MVYHSIELLSDLSERVPYTIPDHPLYAKRARISGYRDMRAASHWHDDLEFGLVLSGSMTYSINGDMQVVEGGQGVFINARQLHGHFSPDGEECEYLCVLIHPSLLCGSAFLKNTYIAPLTENSAFQYNLLEKRVPWQAGLMEAVERIERAMNEGREPCGLAALSAAYEVASLLYAYMPEPRSESTRVDQRLQSLRGMVGYIQRHYTGKIELNDIARAGAVGKSTCYALFRQHLSQTPVQYLTAYRLEKGIELMSNPALSMTEIALAVGFGSPSYFAEVFHKVTGKTPSEYRKCLEK